MHLVARSFRYHRVEKKALSQRGQRHVAILTPATPNASIQRSATVMGTKVGAPSWSRSALMPPATGKYPIKSHNVRRRLFRYSIHFNS